MAEWALIVGGAVAEITDIDPAGRFVASWQWEPIPAGTTVQVGYLYAADAFAAPSPPARTAAQVAQAAYAAFIAGGLTVTSTGTPALNGVYPIDQQSQTDISTEAQFVSTFAEFTTGATTNLPWVLANGTIVTFPTTAEFMAFAKAAGQAVAAAKLALAQSAAMPSAAVTIA